MIFFYVKYSHFLTKGGINSAKMRYKLNPKNLGARKGWLAQGVAMGLERHFLLSGANAGWP